MRRLARLLDWVVVAVLLVEVRAIGPWDENGRNLELSKPFALTKRNPKFLATSISRIDHESKYCRMSMG